MSYYSRWRPEDSSPSQGLLQTDSFSNISQLVIFTRFKFS